MSVELNVSKDLLQEAPLLGETFWKGADKAASVLKSSLPIAKATAQIAAGTAGMVGMWFVASCVANPVAAGYLIKEYQAGMPLTSLALRAGVLGVNTLAAGFVAMMGTFSNWDISGGGGSSHGTTFEGECLLVAKGMYFGLPAYWLLTS